MSQNKVWHHKYFTQISYLNKNNDTLMNFVNAVVPLIIMKAKKILKISNRFKIRLLFKVNFVKITEFEKIKDINFFSSLFLPIIDRKSIIFSISKIFLQLWEDIESYTKNTSGWSIQKLDRIDLEILKLNKQY